MKLFSAAAIVFVVFLTSKAGAKEAGDDQAQEPQSVKVPRSRKLSTRTRFSRKASKLEFVRGDPDLKCVDYQGELRVGADVVPRDCENAPAWKYSTSNTIQLNRRGRKKYCIEASASFSGAFINFCSNSASRQKWWFVRRIVKGTATYAMYNEARELFLELTDSRTGFKLDAGFPDDEQDIVKISSAFFRFR